MLTDEELTRELSDAFREATAGLEYAGRVPTPRRVSVLAVPAAIGTAAAVAVVAGSLGGTPGQEGPAPTTPAPSAAASPQPRLVTDTVTFAGYTFSFHKRAGDPDPVRAEMAPRGLPDGVRRIAIDPPARAWIGRDPESGDAALYLQAPTRNQGRMFVLLSSVWDQRQLVHLLRTGRPNG